MLRVAIAEDDFRVAQIHEQYLLKIKDVEVVGKALNASETIQLLDAHQVDLLLLDIYMPDELGTNILPEIRERFPNVDIIMITAATEKTLLKKAIQYGISNYLIKPITMDKFTETIQHYKRKKALLEDETPINQTLLDQYFGTIKFAPSDHKDLPKGIDSLTLQKVIEIMKKRGNGISAEEMGEQMGASRTTARRYLEYLVSIDEARAKIEYGIVGRPERQYSLKPSR
ncbi:response regulator [Fictibacillus sp. Mic-4]|uniref:response regulator n=1 Tax=Fictibacillus TaxID=1329200 RepID=UPI0003FC4FD6|nr:response regulator [Fictibacillus gelatini]